MGNWLAVVSIKYFIEEYKNTTTVDAPESIYMSRQLGYTVIRVNPEKKIVEVKSPIFIMITLNTILYTIYVSNW